MSKELIMAVCRKTRVVKLTIVGLLLVGALYLIFPEELKQILAKFAPPDLEKGKANDEVIKDIAAARQQHRKHSESETYLTPGNPGNFEPLRDEEEEGPGEKGVAHHLKPEQEEKADDSINEYGKNEKYYQITI